MKKKKLLFITPVNPLAKSRGRNLRAYSWVHHLIKKYEVTILCTSVSGEFYQTDEKKQVSDIPVHYYRKKLGFLRRIFNLLLLKPTAWNSVTGSFKKWIGQEKIGQYDVVLCFRLVNIPAGFFLFRQLNCSELWLDLDEVDSDVKRQISTLQFCNGDIRQAMRMRLESQLYRVQEWLNLNRFQKIFVTTAAEKQKLRKIYSIEKSEIFENKLAIRRTDCKNPGRPFRFLFVGNSGYYPNYDAISFIADEVIPSVREKTTIPFKCTILGGGDNNKLLEKVRSADEIEYIYDLDDLTELYDNTDAVLIPLRAGGGSSFKLIEAMSFSKPIVATPVGVRGFNLNPDQEVLIGTTADELAEQCCKLMENTDLFRKLSRNGQKWFIEHNSFEPVF
ncbi:MAG: glycosyltransferase family 4 protein [Balneolaceae bacterium]|nr:glycosyltransferase family 4 protein [Balneolaceae bacterium]